MKKLVVLGFLALLMVSVAALAADTKALGVGKTRSITFIEDVKVGNTVLKAGDYQVRHEMDGNNHVLVFRSVDHGKAKARVNCTMVELPQKADQTLIMFDKGPSGEKVLSGITFRGESYRHQL